ncbi:hypothetical protein ACET9S_02675 [Aeromonas caviae]
MMMQINGHNAQDEALPKFGQHFLHSHQMKAGVDNLAFNQLVAVLVGGEQ